MRYTDKEAQMLATLYESPVWPVFRKKLLEERQLVLAKEAPFLTNIELIRQHAGAITELTRIEEEMAVNHRKQEKK